MNKELIRAFRRNLRRVERGVENSLKSQTACCGVSSAQCHALLELAELEPASLAALSKVLELDSSTVSRTVDSLVEDGLAERRRDPKSRRRVILTLTAAGKKKAAAINKACDALYSAAARKFSHARITVLVEGARLLADLMDMINISMAGGCCARKEGI